MERKWYNDVNQSSELSDVTEITEIHISWELHICANAAAEFPCGRASGLAAVWGQAAVLLGALCISRTEVGA